MNSTARATLRAAALLASCASIAAALLAGTHALTRERIVAEQRKAELSALAIVLPAGLHDNDLLADRIDVVAPSWLGSPAPLTVWRARRDGEPAALILQAVAPDGYAAPIRLLVGVATEGHVTGVRVVEHRETPGLGDGIDAARGPWIESFTGRSLTDPDRAQWRVRRDGGQFDQFAGATITPRAVVAAVRRSLDYAKLHADELFSATSGSTLTHADAPPN